MQKHYKNNENYFKSNTINVKSVKSKSKDRQKSCKLKTQHQGVIYTSKEASFGYESSIDPGEVVNFIFFFL